MDALRSSVALSYTLSTLAAFEESWASLDILGKLAGIPSPLVLFSWRRLRWLGRVTRMDRSLKDVLYGELPTGIRPVRRPALRYRGVCKRNMKAGKINPSTWEATAANTAADGSGWRQIIKAAVHKS